MSLRCKSIGVFSSILRSHNGGNIINMLCPTMAVYVVEKKNMSVKSLTDFSPKKRGKAEQLTSERPGRAEPLK